MSGLKASKKKGKKRKKEKKKNKERKKVIPVMLFLLGTDPRSATFKRRSKKKKPFSVSLSRGEIDPQ